MNVTQSLLKEQSRVKDFFRVTGNWSHYAKSPYYAGRFGSSAYYAPYMARYTTGQSFPAWHPERSAMPGAWQADPGEEGMGRRGRR